MTPNDSFQYKTLHFHGKLSNTAILSLQHVYDAYSHLYTTALSADAKAAPAATPCAAGPCPSGAPGWSRPRTGAPPRPARDTPVMRTRRLINEDILCAFASCGAAHVREGPNQEWHGPPRVPPASSQGCSGRWGFRVRFHGEACSAAMRLSSSQG